MVVGPVEIHSLDDLELFKGQIVSFKWQAFEDDENLFYLNNKSFGYIHQCNQCIEGEEKLTFSILCEQSSKNGPFIHSIMLSNTLLETNSLIVELPTENEISLINGAFKNPLSLGRSFKSNPITKPSFPISKPSSDDNETSSLLKKGAYYTPYYGVETYQAGLKNAEPNTKNQKTCFLM